MAAPIRAAISSQASAPIRGREALWALVRAWIRVRMSSPARLARHLARLRLPVADWGEAEGAAGARAANDPDVHRAVDQAIDRACRRVRVPFSCLMRALAAHALLARRGLPSTLILGVRTARRADGSLLLEAHAWPDHAPDDGFTWIATFPSAGER
jgi:hypothetical protein